MENKITIMGKKILKNIFSINNYNETHTILRLFGIKIKFPKLEYLKIMKNLPYNTYKRKNLDITSLPPAQGRLRDIQLANLALLMEMDFVCKENNLKYWIDFGSLLGAVRHKGFIPWYDDVDCGMLRDDYEKIIDAFNKSCRNPDIFADYFRCPYNPCQLIIKVQHKKCSKLFVDIFPYDMCNKKLSTEEQIKQTLKLKDIRKEMEKECTFSDSNEFVKNVIKNHIKTFNTNALDEKFDYNWGLDFNHHWKNWLASSDMIFPLKEIVFENGIFPCVNDTDGYLKKVYGNYMSYPKKFGYGHNMFAKLTEEEYNIIKELRSLSEKNYNIRDF